MSARLPLLRQSLRTSWHGLLGWAAGIVAALCLYLPLYPSIGGNSQMKDLIASLPPELTNAIGYSNISTGAGYTQATFFGLLGYLLFSAAAASWGASALAGDEERGTLELTLAHGVGRRQVVAERTAAVVVRLVGLAILVAAVVLAWNGPAQLGLELVNILLMSAGLASLAVLMASAGLAVGALTGRRSGAVVAGAGVAVISYAFNAVGSQGDQVSWLKNLSPYSWLFEANPLSTGGGGLVVLAVLGISAVLVAVATVALSVRDIGN